MAQADTSIYNALLQPPKSALEWQNAYAAQDDARQTRQMNALQLQSVQGKLQDESQGRSDAAAYRSILRPGMAPDDQISAAESSGNPYAMAQAQAMRKAQLEAQQAQAKTEQAKAAALASTASAGHSAAQTEALRIKSEIDKHDRALNEIMAFASPAEAMQSLQRHAAEGSIGQQEAQGVSRQLMGLSTPEQWQQWQDSTLMKLMDAKSRAELQMRRMDFQQRARNDTILPNGDVNQPLIDAQIAKSRAGAPVTNVRINEGQKGFENESKLRDNFKQEPVYKAHQEMDSAHRQIKAALLKADPISDMAAATKIMKLLDPGSVVRESELGMAMAASGLMDRVTNYADSIIKGTKLTPTQRKEFGVLADSLYSQSVEQFDLKRGEYVRLGGDYGLNADRALGGVGRPAPATKKPDAKAPPVSPKPGTVDGGYRFKGGDPSNSANWEKV